MIDKRFAPVILSSKEENNDEFKNKVSKVTKGGGRGGSDNVRSLKGFF